MQNRIRPYAAPVPTMNTKKTELQRRMEAMSSACNGMAFKNKHHIRIENEQHTSGRAEIVRTSSPILAVADNTTAPVVKKVPPPVDPLQNCYGRSTRGQSTGGVSEDGPKGILSKPSTPKPATPKKVSFNLDANGFEPPLGTSNDGNGLSSVGSNSVPGGASTTPLLPAVRGKGSKAVRAPLFQPTSTRPTRPSLSEQLSAIANKAGDITAEIKANAGILTPSTKTGSECILHSTPVKNFTVGTLQCRYTTGSGLWHHVIVCILAGSGFMLGFMYMRIVGSGL